MRVLMLSRVSPCHGPGGLGASAWDLAGALARAGAQVRLLTTSGGGPDGVDGVAVETAPAPAGRYSAAWWRESVRAFARQGGWAQVVLGVSSAANALAARRVEGGPAFVFQAHGTSVGELASRLRAPHARALAGAARQLYWGVARDRAYRDYDAVVAVGEAVRRQLVAWPTCELLGSTPVHLIPNGVDAPAFAFDPQARRTLRAGLQLSPDAPVALFAGRMQADKGPLQAVEMVRRAVALRPELTLLLVGDGPQAQSVQARLAGAGLQANTRWLGPLGRADLVGAYSAADVLLFPTRRAEGLALVVLEALAGGLPVLTTPFGAADAALPCQRRLPGDLDGFTTALATVDPGQDRASRLSSGFTLQASAAGYLDLFDRLLSSSARLAA